VSVKKFKLVSPPSLEDTFFGVAFQHDNLETNFTVGEQEDIARLLRAYKRTGLLGAPKFIYADEGYNQQKFSGILVPRQIDGCNAFYIFKKTDPKAAAEYTLVMRDFVESKNLGERVETINFPLVINELRSFFYEQAPQASHLRLVK
jgi:hypothetical protein